jgi:adenosylcobinamide-phosphate synthase
MEMNIWTERAVVLLLALILDITLGEPPEKIHPTVWFGNLIHYLDRIYATHDRIADFLAGTFVTLTVILFALFLSVIPSALPEFAAILLSAFFLKSSFSLKALEVHVRKTIEPDIDEQRKKTSMIVSRDLSGLKRHEICSASIESLAENSVDSYISPTFYFLIFGLPGAMVYRAVNTCDAMLGYRIGRYLYFGKFAARVDDILNFIPARLSVLLFLPLSPKRVISNLKRAKYKINGDKPIACMSAVCGVQLEKKGSYIFPGRKPELKDIFRAIKVFRIVVVEWTAILFLVIVLLSKN